MLCKNPTVVSVEARRCKGGRWLVAVGGEIDLATTSVLASGIAEAMDEASQVVVDLSEVTFMDSNGVQVLLAALHRADERAIDFHVLAPPGPARRLIELTNVGQALSMAESIQEIGAPSG